MSSKTTSGSLLHAREVEDARMASKGNKTTSGSCLHAREVDVVSTAWKHYKGPPPACFCMQGRWRRANGVET